jgi:predicted cobalt transporter CbtA
LAAIRRGCELLRALILAIEEVAAAGVAAAQAAEAAGKQVEAADEPAWKPEDVSRVINQAVAANGYTALHWWVDVCGILAVDGSRHVAY